MKPMRLSGTSGEIVKSTALTRVSITIFEILLSRKKNYIINTADMSARGGGSKPLSAKKIKVFVEGEIIV